MNLQIKDQLFLVGGATSGFGLATTQALAAEGAHIIAIARGKEKLEQLQQQFPNQVQILAMDISYPTSIDTIIETIGNRQLHGAFINAGGPPALPMLETKMEDWDNAYYTILRWKVALALALVPIMSKHQYGRLVFIESSSVRQPIENLVLSTSLRLAVVGMAKTLSQEIASLGITLNIMAPGSHDTPAIERVYNKKSQQTGLAFQEVKEAAIKQIPVGGLGKAEDFASLAIWLLSPQSRFVTGQTIAVEGGMVKGTF